MKSFSTFFCRKKVFSFSLYLLVYRRHLFAIKVCWVGSNRHHISKTLRYLLSKDTQSQEYGKLQTMVYLEDIFTCKFFRWYCLDTWKIYVDRKYMWRFKKEDGKRKSKSKLKFERFRIKIMHIFKQIWFCI